ncbi:uncharacterized protein LOC107265005 [Cephus cinctus]|uniref:Uncharacterized protein LOC107265005 n=1 Tax=Cephus cinctus TaxID=211228 RepID=A0AAJ7FFL3_CEPCN|nr:uncharacterized protein LOC107265005 [Cephus cinctus]
MRRASFDKHNNTKRNILSNVAYNFTTNVKDAGFKCINYNHHESNYLQRSVSADNVVIRSRGFKPSDRHDPVKRNLLESLTSKILHFDMESGETTPINLQKLLTPASDTNELLHAKNKKMYASSYFYAPTHPTVEDQVELARRISHSLSDVKNLKSKGQSMYVNRKKRSVKWIHDGNGAEGEEESSSPVHKDKVPLKCVMNPNGKVLDIHGIQALGEEVNIETMPSHPEKLFDIVRDLNNQKGRGAEIFAKRRKRSEKWVVDQEKSQTPTTPGLPKVPTYPSKHDMELKENSKLPTVDPLPPYIPATPAPVAENKPFYNPFTLDLSLNGVEPPATDARKRFVGTNKNRDAKKVHLREVAVGTDIDFLVDEPGVEKSRRISFDGTNGTYGNHTLNTNRSCKPVINTNPGKLISITNSDIRNHSKQQYQECNEGEDSEYTPVPVKQLIQEFEKTCRPVMQYKQISTRVIPIVQQCPLESDISRYFEARVSTRYDETPRMPEEKIIHNYDDADDDDDDDDNDDDDDEYDDPGYQRNGQILYEEDEDDELEDGFLPSSSSRVNDDHLFRQESPVSSLINGNGYVPMEAVDEYYRKHIANSQTFKLDSEHRNGSDKFLNDDGDPLPNAKSLLLAMVASQDDILATIKHLRSTPVLENLVSNASPDCKFADVYPDVGNKLYENNYQGPKLSSFQTLTNYNTAPRGWNQSHTFYRPITFGKPQDTIVYSDF